MADDDLKERIREATDIVEVIGERIPLKKAGKNFVARCPFHVEKTPSFNVNQERQFYHCFGCGAGGDVFSFVIAYDKVSFPEAMRTLAQRAGIVMNDRQAMRTRAKEEAYDAYYQANALARDFFVETLNDAEKGAAARDYLARRGLSGETIRKFGIGYAPDAWDGLLSLARVKGIGPKVLEEAGLVVRNEQGRVYDRFRGRVTFPIVNQSGRVVAFGARTLDPEGQPKYLNSSESPVYQKSRLLYGLFHARDAMRGEGRVMIVEGYVDVLQLVQAGIEDVVATCGTALTREHGQALRRYAEKIVLIFDGDAAGVRAARRAGDVLLEAGIEASVALLPEGDDPDTLVAAEGPDALRTIADQGMPFLLFKWRSLGKEHDLGTTTGRNGAVGEMLDGIAPVEDEIVRNLMAAQVAEWGGVDDALVLRALEKRRKAGRRRDPDTSERRPVRKWSPPPPEKELVSWMLDRPWVCQLAGEMGLECFSDPLLHEIATALVRLNDEGEAPSAVALLDEKPDDPTWSGAVAALTLSGYDEREAEVAVTQLVTSLQLPFIRRKIDHIRARLREPLETADAKVLSRELNELNLEYEQLHNATHL